MRYPGYAIVLVARIYPWSYNHTLACNIFLAASSGDHAKYLCCQLQGGFAPPPRANFEPDLVWKKEKKMWSSMITAEESVAAVQRWRDRESVMCLAWIQQVVMWFLSVCMGLLRLQSFGKKKVSYAWNGG